MTDVLDYPDTLTEPDTYAAPPATGNPRARPRIDDELTEQKLAEIGADVVEDWERDKENNSDWRTKAEAAEKVAAQEDIEAANLPFRGASDVHYPLLTISAMAFHARAYPAIVKGDEAVKVKTFGKDKSGKKQARAQRMADYLNYLLFYKIEGWEEDTDSLLLRLPIVGQHFRKVFFDPLCKHTVIESISALRLTIPPDSPSLERAPRITHDFDRYPHELQSLMRSGDYRKVVLTPDSDDAQAARIILEQHRMMDLDGDGLEEPYIVTVDSESSQVLRIEEGWDEDGIKADENGRVLSIERWNPFVSISFIPDMKGRAYAIGFGHLLTAIMDVVNTNINLMIDAGHAQVAGGGFVASEVRLQTAGKGSKLTWAPGEYKTVNATGADLKNAIYERTFPEPSPVIFQLLGMLMEAAKDIASVNDAITGDAARSAPVGTTLALIEQGQQVFNAIYKRIYRSLRREFRLLADCQRKYGDPSEYAKFCDVEADEPSALMGHNGRPSLANDPEQPAPPVGQDVEGGALSTSPAVGAPLTQGMIPAQPPVPVDPEQLFRDDFNSDDLDVLPVSDPGAVTRSQTMAKAQFVLALVPTGMVNPKVAVEGALQAAGVENVDELMTLEPPKPDPVQLQLIALDAQKKDAEGKEKMASAGLKTAQAAEIAHRSTGAQADVALAHDAALASKNQVEAYALAAGVLGPGKVEQ